jgi:hypothetical protein
MGGGGVCVFGAGFRIRIQIPIVFGSWIRICNRVKSWIRIRIEFETRELQRLKIEPWMAVDAHNGGMEGL